MEKLKEFWESLEEVTTISKRELFLALVSCALAGIVVGALFSPKKVTVIGSNNGNGKNDCTDTESEELEDCMK